MRRILQPTCLLVFLSIFLIGSFFPSPVQAAPWREKVDPWVLQTASQGEAEFLVYLTEQADLSQAANLQTKLEKGSYVYETLTALAERTQPPVRAALDRLGAPYRSYWVANMLWVRGGPAVVQAMAERSDVAHVYANPAVHFDAPTQLTSSAPTSPEAIEWNILKVNADDVWAAGYTGQGVVIGGQDTGYQWDHPALINHYRGWNGSIANHNYQWHDAIHTGNGGVCGLNSPQPCDDYGHGTHTMGTMVGDDGGTNQIGMAPGAKWIGCRNMDVGNGTPATYAECYQWFIAPTDLNDQNPRPDLAPDVINNSWGCPPSEGCTDPTVLLAVVRAVRAAGIVTVHSAGNDGSACGSINTPAAIYAESFTVGATGITDSIASFSSRGPSTYDGQSYLKPNVSAPGVNIRSSVPGGGYEGGWQGTSMAGPHVAGAVALLISAQPSLAGNVASLEALLEQSALPRTTSQTCGGVPGLQVPNNTYGWGRIDVWAAYQLLTAHTLTIQKNGPASSLGDQPITYTLEVAYSGFLPTHQVLLSDTIPANTAFVAATPPYALDNGIVSWAVGELSDGEHFTASLTVRPNAAVSEIVNAQYGVSSQELPQAVSGDPVVTHLLNDLSLSKLAPPIALVGEPITYTLTVANRHLAVPVLGVVLTDVIPAHTTLITATFPYTNTGGLLAWHLGNMAAGQSQTITLVVQPTPDFTGVITNAAYGVRNEDDSSVVLGPPVITQVAEYLWNYFFPLMCKP